MELPDISEGSNNVSKDRQKTERKYRHEMNTKNVYVSNGEKGKLMGFQDT